MLFIGRIFTLHLFSQCCKATRQQRCTRCLHLYRKHFCYSALSQTQHKKPHLKLLSAVITNHSAETEMDMIAALCFTTTWAEFHTHRGEVISNELPVWFFLCLFCLQITPTVFIFPEFIHFSIYFLSDSWGLFSYFKTFNFINLSCFAELRTHICMDVIIKVRSPLITFLMYLEVHKTFWTSEDNTALLNSSPSTGDHSERAGRVLGAHNDAGEKENHTYREPCL